jgi:YHS domain-containing protein
MRVYASTSKPPRSVTQHSPTRNWRDEMSKHWKGIAAGIAGLITLAIVFGGAGRSLAERKPSTGDVIAQRAASGPPPSSGQQPIPAPVVASHGTGSPSVQPGSSGVQRVDPKTVCMVNDRAMGKPQIPVQVGEKTYYGCCEMCKTRLAQDDAVRFALDPVTGETVDKASAVIAVRPDGSVLYFASVETLGQYGTAGDQP